MVKNSFFYVIVVLNVRITEFHFVLENIVKLYLLFLVGVGAYLLFAVFDNKTHCHLYTAHLSYLCTSYVSTYFSF